MGNKAQINIINTVAIFLFLILGVRSLVGFYYSFTQESSMRGDLLAMTHEAEMLKSFFNQERRYTLDKAMLHAGRLGGFVCWSADLNRDGKIDGVDWLDMKKDYEWCVDNSLLCNTSCDPETVVCGLGRLDEEVRRVEAFLPDKAVYYWKNNYGTNIPGESSLVCSMELLMNNYFYEPATGDSRSFESLIRTIEKHHSSFALPKRPDLSYKIADVEHYDSEQVVASFVPNSTYPIFTYATRDVTNKYYDYVKERMASVVNTTSSLLFAKDSRFVKLFASTDFVKMFRTSRELVNTNFEEYFKKLGVPLYITSPTVHTKETSLLCRNYSYCEGPCQGLGFHNGTCDDGRCVCKEEPMFEWRESFIKYQDCDVAGRQCGDIGVCKEIIGNPDEFLDCAIEDYNEFAKQKFIYYMTNELVSFGDVFVRITPYVINVKIELAEDCDPFVPAGYKDFLPVTGASVLGSGKEIPATLSIPLGFFFAVNTTTYVEAPCIE